MLHSNGMKAELMNAIEFIPCLVHWLKKYLIDATTKSQAVIIATASPLVCPISTILPFRPRFRGMKHIQHQIQLPIHCCD